MPAKNFFFVFVCFAYLCSAPLYAQSAHASNTSKTTNNAVVETPVAGADAFVNPRVIPYVGFLKSQPSSTGVAVVFSVYGSANSANPLWQETQNVQADQDGRYTAFLGASHSGGLPSLIFNATEQQWLGVRVAGDSDEQRAPLVRASSYGGTHGIVPIVAKTVGGSNLLPVQKERTTQQPGSSGLVIGTPSALSLPTFPLDSGPVLPLPTVSHVILANSVGEAFTVQQNGSGIAAHITAQTNNAILAETTSTSTAQDTIMSVNRAPGGTAVRAESQASIGSGSGVWGVSAGDAGIGVLGASRSASGATTGVRGESNSPDGTAGVFDSLGGGNILSGRSSGVEKFRVDAQGNITATTFIGDGSKLTNLNATSLGGLSASDLMKSFILNVDGSQLANV
ncbi:MAG TPA: hypothetical protein VHV32_00355, partial [Candidatus Angelobacter sp.]|nr:hypothetical protein [Candidatus Angelobacter sp.]